jgi:hypothetical protein
MARDNTQGDNDMLSLLIHDALAGVDITTRYPASYRRLLLDIPMREAFLDSLDLLEKSRKGELEELPFQPSRDLSFLREEPAQEVIERQGVNHWLLTWQKTKEEITSLFTAVAPLVPAPLRSDADLEAVPLLRHHVDVENIRLDVWLEAQQPLMEPELLSVSLITAVTTTAATIPQITAHLQWGDYQKSATVGQHGQPNFALLPLAAIMDEAGQITAELKFSLEVEWA